MITPDKFLREICPNYLPTEKCSFVILVVNSFYLYCNLPCTFKKYLMMQKSLLFTIFVQLYETPANWLLLIVIDLVFICWYKSKVLNWFDVAHMHRDPARGHLLVRREKTQEWLLQQKWVLCSSWKRQHSSKKIARTSMQFHFYLFVESLANLAVQVTRQQSSI